jgi:hypothetical protein
VYQTFGDEANQYNLNVQFPIFQNSTVYRIKRYNGSRTPWWESIPYVAGTTYFAAVSSDGTAGGGNASYTRAGVPPIFCVA